MDEQHICATCDVELNELMNYCFNYGEKQGVPSSEELKCDKCKRLWKTSF